ncbi:MAG: lytic murein transglycosylase [Mesorhizobium sp.]|nr:MAG: lytic murein transglycosylase [Mesorhizobium sp.]RWO30121.1 MAG: lytic murein transglycosylase [Mesorhizobium sp.]
MYPLCPAGHLPLKGGDWLSRSPSPITTVEKSAAALKLPISPLEGEMAGRPEGGGLAPPAPIHLTPPTP